MYNCVCVGMWKCVCVYCFVSAVCFPLQMWDDDDDVCVYM